MGVARMKETSGGRTYTRKKPQKWSYHSNRDTHITIGTKTQKTKTSSKGRLKGLRSTPPKVRADEKGRFGFGFLVRRKGTVGA